MLRLWKWKIADKSRNSQQESVSELIKDAAWSCTNHSGATELHLPSN